MNISVHGIETTIPRLQEEYIGAGHGESQYPLILLPRNSYCHYVEPVSGLLHTQLPQKSTLLHTTYEKPCALVTTISFSLVWGQAFSQR